MEVTNWPLLIAGVLISWSLISIATAIYVGRYVRTRRNTEKED